MGVLLEVPVKFSPMLCTAQFALSSRLNQRYTGYPSGSTKDAEGRPNSEAPPRSLCERNSATRGVQESLRIDEVLKKIYGTAALGAASSWAVFRHALLVRGDILRA